MGTVISQSLNKEEEVSDMGCVLLTSPLVFRYWKSLLSNSINLHQFGVNDTEPLRTISNEKKRDESGTR